MTLLHSTVVFVGFVAHAWTVHRPCLYLLGRLQHLTSATSSRLDHLARRRLLSWSYYTRSTVRTMLAENDFVHVFSCDFSKAFDTVRHVSLMTKFAQLEIPHCIYNWIIDFFNSQAHCMKYARLISAVTTIHASIIQGSALGPTSYIVTAADLHQAYAENRLYHPAAVQTTRASHCSHCIMFSYFTLHIMCVLQHCNVNEQLLVLGTSKCRYVWLLCQPSINEHTSNKMMTMTVTFWQCAAK